MNAPDVSVIITSYNTAAYIERAVTSALAQTGVSVEVIVVDDVSTDASWQVISAMTDPRIKSRRLECNSGPSVARNTAISMSGGRWLAVLDSDDAYAPGRLAALLQLAQTHQADIVADNLLVCREADGARFPMFAPQRLNTLAYLTLADFIKGNQSFLCGFTLGYLKPMIRRDFLDRHHLRYDPEIRIGEDYFLLASALALGARCALSVDCGYEYTVRKGSISHRLQSADVERIRRCDAAFIARFPLTGAAAQAQRQRERSLELAISKTELINSLRLRKPGCAARILWREPFALAGLWLPVRARLEKYFGLPPLER